MEVIIEQLTARVLGREYSFLAEDVAASEGTIREAVRDARILVIGASGSIGSAFVKELVAYQLRALHLVDISENTLVELVRDLRSSSCELPKDFATFAIDFGRAEMRALLAAESYDYVLNFSALKHVRSERDPLTLMRLLDVNILSNHRLLDWIEEHQQLRKVFSVSSDKAVRSGNLMGASKAFMERIFLARADKIPFGSARFANVAFSDGSLLHSFRNRIAKGQPLSAPNDVRRYFISPQEAGQLCLLGCFVCNNGEIDYPLFNPDEDMSTFATIARSFLELQGLEPIECSSEEEAKERAQSITLGRKQWPCYFSGSNTSGEKAFEEFVDPGEKVDEDRFQKVGVITAPMFHGYEPLKGAIDELYRMQNAGSWTMDDLIETVRQAVPEMQHVKAEQNLDQKM